MTTIAARYVHVTDDGDDGDPRSAAWYRVRARAPLATDTRHGERSYDARLVQWFSDRSEAERCAVALAQDPRCYSQIDIEADDRGPR